MFCPKCGAYNENDSKFCISCGTEFFKTKNEQNSNVYDGKIHKCPNCGETLNSFVTNCPTCGYELRGNATADSMTYFFDKYNLTTKKTQRIDLIKTFVIPNAKEDLLEFAVMASSNIKTSFDDEINNAWLSKLEQIYEKAQLLSDSSFTSKIKELYLKAKKSAKSNNLRSKCLKHKKEIIIFVYLLIAIIFIALIPNGWIGVVLMAFGIIYLVVCGIVKIIKSFFS